MNWTNEKPNQEGFYWLKQNDSILLVRISYSMVRESFYVEKIVTSGSEIRCLVNNPAYNWTLWNGPLKPPETPLVFNRDLWHELLDRALGTSQENIALMQQFVDLVYKELAK